METGLHKCWRCGILYGYSDENAQDGCPSCHADVSESTILED